MRRRVAPASPVPELAVDELGPMPMCTATPGGTARCAQCDEVREYSGAVDEHLETLLELRDRTANRIAIEEIDDRIAEDGDAPMCLRDL